MYLRDIPPHLREARTAALKYVGAKLKERPYNKNVKRRVICELDLEICMRILDKMNEGFVPGVLRDT